MTREPPTHPPDPTPPRPGPAPRLALWCCLLAGPGVCFPPVARAQQPGPLTLRLDRLTPGGVRNTATEAWGAYECGVTNLTGSDRAARLLLYYEGQPDLQYGRDLWVPARSSLSSWLLAGPAPAQANSSAREIRALLYDRSEGAERLVLPPGQERVRSRAVPYLKRAPHTIILVDEGAPETTQPGQLPRPPSRTDEAFLLARAFRYAHYLSPLVQRAPAGPLPPSAEAFDGVDHFVLASERIAADPAGMRALRRWLGQGGTVWVMLDRVGPEALAPLLGEALDFQVLDTVGLTSFRVRSHPAGQDTAAPRLQQHEQPVDLVRVLLPAGERPRHTVDGWPAWFTRRVGRGTAVFTTLGPRGWFRPRKPADPASRYEQLPDFPVPESPLELLAFQIQPQADKEPFSVESFRRPLAEQVGYSVVSRGTAGLVLGGFLLATLTLGTFLRKSRRPELLGWLGPAAAVGAAATFLAVGVASRRSAAPTVAVAQVAHPVPGTDEVALHGLLSVYRPESGPAEVGARRGGLFELDMAGLGGQARRFVLTDLGAWHFEGLSLPAGLRFAPFRATAATATPVRAVATFGPAGLEGRLEAGPFAGPADALLHPGRGGWRYAGGTSAANEQGRDLAVRLGPGGAFRAGSEDVLPAGQYLSGAVLSDAQQRRQELYRRFLASGKLPAGPALLAWAEPADVGFDLAPGARTVGSALLVAPLRLRRPDPGARVTIPGPLVPYQRIVRGAPARPVLESGSATDLHLRFQLPPEVLPLRVKRARLDARVEAPSRTLTVSGDAGGKSDGDPPGGVGGASAPHPPPGGGDAQRLGAPHGQRGEGDDRTSGGAPAGTPGGRGGTVPGGAPPSDLSIGVPHGQRLVELRRVDSPLDPIRVEITDERLLRPDAAGGLHLHVRLGELPAGVSGEGKWVIRYLELEVTGVVAPAATRPPGGRRKRSAPFGPRATTP